MEAEIQAVMDAYKEINIDDDFVNEGLNGKVNELMSGTVNALPSTEVVVYDNNKVSLNDSWCKCHYLELDITIYYCASILFRNVGQKCDGKDGCT